MGYIMESRYGVLGNGTHLGTPGAWRGLCGRMYLVPASLYFVAILNLLYSTFSAFLFFLQVVPAGLLHLRPRQRRRLLARRRPFERLPFSHLRPRFTISNICLDAKHCIHFQANYALIKLLVCGFFTVFEFE